LSKLSNFYNVPLRDISEFLNVRREEISQLERQKRQMDRMADLARKEEKEARMVFNKDKKIRGSSLFFRAFLFFNLPQK